MVRWCCFHIKMSTRGEYRSRPIKKSAGDIAGAKLMSLKPSVSRRAQHTNKETLHRPDRLGTLYRARYG